MSSSWKSSESRLAPVGLFWIPILSTRSIGTESTVAAAPPRSRSARWAIDRIDQALRTPASYVLPASRIGISAQRQVAQESEPRGSTSTTKKGAPSRELAAK